jgi:secondary thiamine-phosphate synthase enzyme
MQETIRVSTDDRLEAVPITDRVASWIPDDLDAGTCHVYSRHTTTGVLLNENESRLRADVEELLADLVPADGHRHDELDGNTVRLASLA